MIFFFFLHQLVSFVVFQIQAPCNSPSMTTTCAAFTPQWAEAEERGEPRAERIFGWISYHPWPKC